MVLKKHYLECNLYTLINYLGQGVKTIPNDITFRQSTLLIFIGINIAQYSVRNTLLLEYFQHWVRCDIFLLVFVKITLMGNWHYYPFWYQ